MNGGPFLNGIGLACSLGTSLDNAMALFEKGAKRFVKDAGLRCYDGLPLTHAPLFRMGAERNYAKRLLRLLDIATVDLRAQVGNRMRMARIVILLPAWLRAETWGSAIADWEPVTGLIPSIQVLLLWSDETTWPRVLATARSEAILTPMYDIIVMTVDSFMQADVLDHLMAADRVLSSVQPHGFVPSEAAVALRFTVAEAVDTNAAFGWLDGHWQAQEPQDVFAPTDILGDPMADIFCSAAAFAPVDRLLIDLNGERWRSEEVAMALARTTDIPSDLMSNFETPATQAGYSGIAMPAVMLACAMGAKHAVSPPKSERCLIAISTITGPRDVLGYVRGNRPDNGWGTQHV